MFEDFGWIHLTPLLKGAWLTIVLCFFATLFGSLLGIIVGIAATSPMKIFRILSSVYINLIRGIPLLMLIFTVYFVLPLLNLGFELSQGASAILALSIYTGAYMGEIVRGGIQAIDKGQFEAARALGMNYMQMFLQIIFPQAIKFMIPPGIGFVIALVKDSSLVSIIGYVDLTKAGKVVSNLTLSPIPTYLTVALIYFVICYVLSKVSYFYERKYLQAS
ncbi:amino acid ABC transporter permease [bacterium LRH843]|nr:amino acid ABC transporter permease [bacterium LRH843]